MWRQRKCFIYVQFTASLTRLTNSSSKKYITHFQDSKNQRNTPFSRSRNITNASNSSPRGATGSNSADTRRSSNRISTTRPVATRVNESPTINCITTNTNKRALIPSIINRNTEIQALCDP
ncbi:hypothetical protein AVEN_23174-1 [Araneus ventricosus]|uniref:Uncharacterized protein n=1 Tax=Araneus ventricosus TaxID=182803 RepID=A0A4Y2G6E9_ARAVE|nr:hypothetical protein AVEN_23174-1 [Araneus ventricosus]